MHAIRTTRLLVVGVDPTAGVIVMPALKESAEALEREFELGRVDVYVLETPFDVMRIRRQDLSAITVSKEVTMWEDGASEPFTGDDLTNSVATKARADLDDVVTDFSQARRRKDNKAPPK